MIQRRAENPPQTDENGRGPRNACLHRLASTPQIRRVQGVLQSASPPLGLTPELWIHFSSGLERLPLHGSTLPGFVLVREDGGLHVTVPALEGSVNGLRSHIRKVDFAGP